MKFKHTNNTNSKFYLKDNKFSKKNPKFIAKEIGRILSKNLNNFNKNKIVNFIDIGCANGRIIEYLKSISLNVNFIGTDIEKAFIKYCKKNIPNAEFYLDDLRKKPNKLLPLANIIFLSGVHSHFDNPEIYLNGCIKRCSKNSKIIIHGLFNPHNVDVLIKYKKSNDYDIKKNIIDQTGWNMFSITTIKKLLKRNKKIRNFEFIKIKFPNRLKVKKNSNNPIRSWTQNILKQKFFINGLNLVQHQYFLIINLR